MKPKKQPMYIFEVVVEGSGHFPLDMLRYDHAVPAHQEDVSKLLDNKSHRRITLHQF